VTPEEAIRKARSGEVLPVYLLVGEEQYAAIGVIATLRETALGGGLAEFNEEKLVAGEASVDRVLSAARMAPMMSKRRVVLVRSLERWDAKSSEEGGEVASEAADDRVGPLDRIADYAAAPVPETCLILVATKLDGRRKLMALARKGGWLVSCEPLARGALPAWIITEARERGHAIQPDVADLLAEIAGPELGSVADALERVSLYVGTAQPITEDAISACVVRVRQSTVWELVGAVGRRQLGPALAALGDVYDPRDRGLRLVGVLAWSVRQLIKFEAAVRTGAAPEEAARRAGAPPFKARDLAAQVRAIPPAELERWLLLLAETDLELKGGKRPPRAIVEDTVMQMCAGTRAPARPSP
jgi:DNA polymerase-3 subunit delta